MAIGQLFSNLFDYYRWKTLMELCLLAFGRFLQNLLHSILLSAFKETPVLEWGGVESMGRPKSKANFFTAGKIIKHFVLTLSSVVLSDVLWRS
jgi:hypothetical protein